MARIIILAARNWSIKDKDTGQTNSGVKVEGSETSVSDDPDYRGSGAVEYAATPEAWNQLSRCDLPGIFEVEIGLRKAKNARGQSVAVASILSAVEVDTIDFVSPVKKAA